MTVEHRSLAIRGIGKAQPANVMTQEEAFDLAQQICSPSDEQARLLKVLYRRSGVQSRRTVLPHQVALNWVPGDRGGVATTTIAGPTTEERMEFYRDHAAPLAVAAARSALASAEVDASRIRHLITVTCTGFVAPGVDLALINELGLPDTVERSNVAFMGCHGAINGLRVARGLAGTDANSHALLCAVELCSLHYQFRWDPLTFVGNAIFADGAAALVGQMTGEPTPWRVAATGSCLIPDSADAMGWQLGDHGFEMHLSPRVPDLIQSHLRPWIDQWLSRHGLGIADVGSWAVHPGGPRVLNAVEESLGLERRQTAVSREVLAECGNMSSPTVLFIVDRLRSQSAALPCVMLAFGPGLVAEAALLL